MNWWKNLNPVTNTKAKEFQSKICNGIKGKVRFQELLKEHTTFKIGGKAKYFVEPKDTEDLKLLINLAKRYKIPLLVIGAGSNILINDKGIDGVVIRLNSPFFKKISIKNNHLYAGGGVLLSQTIKLASKYGLSGLEFLTGIPGTIGGALVMNAGAAGKNIGELVKMVRVMDYNGNIKNLHKKNLRFGYRESNLSRYIILSAQLKTKKMDKIEIQNKINEYLGYRRITQDLSKPSAGCIFKNPPGESTGRLIETCGLKGKRIGDAYISEKHANFILNRGRAKAGDVLKLMELIKNKVEKKFNITLEPEIKIWY